LKYSSYNVNMNWSIIILLLGISSILVGQIVVSIMTIQHDYIENEIKKKKHKKKLLIIICLSGSFGVILLLVQSLQASEQVNQAKKDADNTTEKLNEIIFKSYESSYQLNNNLTKSEILLNKTETISQNLITEINNGTELLGRIGRSMRLQQLLYDRQEQLISYQDLLLYEQNSLHDENKKLYIELLKENYPLEPIELIYEIEYPMGDSRFTNYANRLLSYVINDSSGISLYNITNNKDLLPNGSEEEILAQRIFNYDIASFNFYESNKDSNNICFNDISYSTMGNKLISFSVLSDSTWGRIDYSIYADIARRVFIKKIKHFGPKRIGSDISSLSSVDLINRKMTWHLIGVLKSISLKFAYNNQPDEYQRHIIIPGGCTFIRIIPSDIFMEHIFTKYAENLNNRYRVMVEKPRGTRYREVRK
jgi:hypothetical protein